MTSGALVLAGAWGVLGNQGFVWTTRLDHVFIFGVVAICCLAAGLTLIKPTPSAKLAIGVVGALGALGWAWVGSEVGASVELGSLQAPSDAGRPYEAVVVQDGLSLTKVVKVRQIGGLGARQWVAACLYDDSGESVLVGLQWSGTGQLDVTSDSGTGSVIVDELTGRPGAVTGALARRC